MTTSKENEETLKKIEIALQNFPKVLERQRRAAEHQKEMMRRFDPFSKQLLELVTKLEKEKEKEEIKKD